MTGALDCDGKELILDGDADTSITADTDDQIDFRIAGADDFQMTANTFTALAGSAIVQADGIMALGASTTSTAMTLGFIFDQAGNDNQIGAFKSSDVASGGFTHLIALETDDFGAFAKAAGGGGLVIQGVQDSTTVDAAIQLAGASLDADVDAVNTTTNATIEVYAAQHDSAGTLGNMEAGANVFAVKARVGGSNRTIFVVDEDGDLFADSGTSTTAVTVFDKENDPELCRTLDLLSPNAIQGKWDQFIQYNEQSLIDTEILGGPVTHPNPDGSFGLVNITKLQKLHNGAIWQLYTKYMDLYDRYERLESNLARDGLYKPLEGHA